MYLFGPVTADMLVRNDPPGVTCKTLEPEGQEAGRRDFKFEVLLRS